MRKITLKPEFAISGQPVSTNRALELSWIRCRHIRVGVGVDGALDVLSVLGLANLSSFA